MTENTEVIIAKLKTRVSQLEEENRKWMRLAGTNRLTGIPNSLMLFQVVLPRELKKGIPLACVLVCPDGLGEINQRHGRVVGDQLLKKIGDFFKQKLESGEQLFHCDGANFAVLISEGTESKARRRGTLLKNEFKETTFASGDEQFSDLTCSAGVAEIDTETEKGNVLERIEKFYLDLCNRLYQAKEQGGNVVIGQPKF